jgi:hypothetical protein
LPAASAARSRAARPCAWLPPRGEFCLFEINVLCRAGAKYTSAAWAWRLILVPFVSSSPHQTQQRGPLQQERHHRVALDPVGRLCPPGRGGASLMRKGVVVGLFFLLLCVSPGSSLSSATQSSPSRESVDLRAQLPDSLGGGRPLAPGCKL